MNHNDNVFPQPTELVAVGGSGYIIDVANRVWSLDAFKGFYVHDYNPDRVMLVGILKSRDRSGFYIEGNAFHVSLVVGTRNIVDEKFRELLNYLDPYSIEFRFACCLPFVVSLGHRIDFQ